MNYELLIKIAEEEKRINLSDVEVIVDELLQTKENGDFYLEDYTDSSYYKIGQIAKQISNKNISLESCKADIYHNVAVSYARRNFYDWACMILQRGLEEKPTAGAVDLLADYLEYGISCNRQESCGIYFQRLCNTPRKKWNWRAYSFSIDYLLDSQNTDVTEEQYAAIKLEALNIANEAIKRYGDDQAYLSKATIYRNDSPKDERKVLEVAVKKLGYAAPKCALRLADILFDAAEYEEAIKILQICCNTYHVQKRINKEYVRLLLALCKTSILFQEHPEGDYEAYKDRVESIYRDINAALKEDNHRRFNETAKLLYRVIAALTGIKYSYTSDEDTYDDFEEF